MSHLTLLWHVITCCKIEESFPVPVQSKCKSHQVSLPCQQMKEYSAAKIFFCGVLGQYVGDLYEGQALSANNIPLEHRARMAKNPLSL